MHFYKICNVVISFSDLTNGSYHKYNIQEILSKLDCSTGLLPNAFCYTDMWWSLGVKQHICIDRAIRGGEHWDQH